jgi:hypothetical protein
LKNELGICSRNQALAKLIDGDGGVCAHGIEELPQEMKSSVIDWRPIDRAVCHIHLNPATNHSEIESTFVRDARRNTSVYPCEIVRHQVTAIRYGAESGEALIVVHGSERSQQVSDLIFVRCAIEPDSELKRGFSS